MPATVSHPIAVLPLKRFCPRWFNFAALIVGAITPDFGYYALQFKLAALAHTFIGSFLVCLPVGCVLLIAFYCLRRSFCYLLPQPHRGSLMTLCFAPPSWGFKSVLSALVSILIGTWTHIAWDSFTHDGALLLRQSLLLRATVLHVGGTELHVSYMLQQFSTLGGAVGIIVAYRKWLRQRRHTVERSSPGEERWRYMLLGGLAAIALAIAIRPAIGIASQFAGYLAVRVFIFRTSVYATAVFVLLFIGSSVVVYWIRRENPES
jgi:small-conductance mechanosensitive channel